MSFATTVRSAGALRGSIDRKADGTAAYASLSIESNRSMMLDGTR